MDDPRTNATTEQMARELASCGSFAICGHVNPDGDCLGSQLALAAALRALGKRADVLLVEDAPVEEGLRFLPGFDGLVPAERYDGAPEAFVYVDVSVRSRIGAAARIADAAARRFAIDHHAADEDVAELNLIDPDAASCTILIWDVVGALGVERTPAIATCAYTGLMTDTGRFQYQNADARAFAAASQMVEAGAMPAHAAREVFQSRSVPSLRLEQRMLEHMEFLAGGECVLSYVTLDDYAACGAESADAESLIDTLRTVRGARIACLLKGRPGLVRGSLRAKDDGTDVAAIARVLGGGGHRAAAGFTLHCPMEDAISQVKDLLPKR